MKKISTFGLLTFVGALAMALPAMAATTTSVVSGTVTSMATYELKVKVGTKTYTTTETATTTYWDATGKTLNVSSIAVGDHVWVYGVKSVPNLTITTVTKVKDLSVTTTSISGKVKSMGTDTLQVKVGSKTYTTTESATTTYWNKKGASSTVATIKVGDTVQVWGQRDIATHTVMNVTKVKDKSR